MLLLLLLHLLRAALLSLCFFSSVFSVGQTKISSAAWPITRVNSVGAAGEEAEGRSWVDNPLVAEPHFEFNR